MAEEIINRGKTVTAAATGINLALGVLYTWSIFKGAIKESIEAGGPGAFNWDPATLNDPYAVCCLVFACTMILAGKCQDRLGPRVTAIIGGLLVGAGFVWISQTTAYMSWVLGFGVLAGTGIAFGYSSATPPALKWFPPSQTGKIAGIVVSGFGLASLYIAPLAQYLLGAYGLQHSMLFFGIGFLLVVCLFALFLVNPPAGYVAPVLVDRRGRSEGGRKGRALIVDQDYSPAQMLRTPSFWVLWLLYFIGAGVGLMVIGSVAGLAKKSMGDAAFVSVALLAVGNAGGRVVAGVVSDMIGRVRTLSVLFIFQAVLMLAAIPITGAVSVTPVLLVLLATLIGFNYGANLALFPALTKDFFGIKNFGVNYGVLFTSWGLGGFVMSRASQVLMAKTQSFAASFLAAAVLLAT
ncbi:MAG: OFA family MFS transporter, partial [Desulfobulbaceae bacterium]|nr:OFA family MFS transporter [Desulfobulbaceae bacterium]